MNPNQLDPQVVNLAKAIRHAESGNRPVNPQEGTKVGGASRYQYTHDTWKGVAGKYLGDSNAQLSLENENKATYLRIKDWKEQGRTPQQIASMWNAGEGKPDAYRENWKGVNSSGIAYDTPAYVERVGNFYNQIKAGVNPGIGPNAGQPSQMDLNAQPQTPPAQAPVPQNQAQQPEEDNAHPSLVQQLKGRFEQGNTAINRTVNEEQGVGSGAFQVAGAVAGGLLDTAGAALKSIPVFGSAVQSAEDAIGWGVKKLAGTAPGKYVGDVASQFSEEHPTAAANIGAGVNIASAVPLMRGVGVGVNAAKAGTRRVISGSIEKEATKELASTIARVRTGATTLDKAKARGLDPIARILSEKAIPDITKDAKGINRYDTTNAEKILGESISKIDDKLTAVLRQKNSNGELGRVNFADLKTVVTQQLTKELKGSPDLKSALRKIEDDFESIMEGYGNNPSLTLEELNDVKRMIRKSVNFNSPELERSVRYHEGQVIMKVIERIAEKHGLGDVRSLNKEMAERIEAEQILSKYVNRKSVMENPGMRAAFGRQGEAAATAAGEALGQSISVPLVGGMLGRHLFSGATKSNASAFSRYKPGKKLPVRSLAASGIAQSSVQGEETQSR